MVEQGPTFGVSRVRVVVKSLAPITPNQNVPSWVVAGASVAEFTNEIRVSPPLITDSDSFIVSLTPKRAAKANTDYTVVAQVGDGLATPQTVRWTANQIDRRVVKEVEWRDVELRAGVRIVVNVLRGLSVNG